MKALTYLGADAYWRQHRGAHRRLRATRPRWTTSSSPQSSLEPRAAQYGEPYYCGHRADLMTSLLMALPPGVCSESRLVAFEEQSRATCGSSLRTARRCANLLIGADGLRSASRKLLMGEREARFTDVVVWRGLIPREKVPGRYDAKIVAWFGPRRHVLLYPLRHDRHPDSVYSLSAFVPATEVRRESWTAWATRPTCTRP